MDAKIAIARCQSYNPALVLEAVKKTIDLLGGISNFVKPESSVLVKPNLLMAKEPEFGITTHPEVVRAVVKILKEINCEVYIGDGPSVWGNQAENIDKVYEQSGIKRIAEEEGVELIKFDKRRWRRKFPLTAWLDNCDYFISVPKFKTHEFITLTGAIKNLFGLVCGTYKTELHKEYFDKADFANILVDIYKEAKPALTIIDGIVAMEGDGPGTSGKLRNSGVILAGCDCVALDSVLALIMGLKPYDILTNRVAAEKGLGTANINSIEIRGEQLNEVIGKPFQLPAASIRKNIPRPLVTIAKKLIRYFPCLEPDKCIKCTVCIKVCPNNAINIKSERINFNYSKCIACFCCQEACPNSAIKVRKSLFAKMIGL